jgi:hypothetical protein
MTTAEQSTRVRIECSDGTAFGTQIKDDAGRLIDEVTKIEWSVDVSTMMARAVIHLDMLGAIVEVKHPQYVIHAGQQFTLPLPDGLTPAQAQEVRDLLGSVVSEQYEEVERLRKDLREARLAARAKG